MLKFFRIITVVALIGWMVLIFSLSAENAATSSGTSGRIIATVVRIFYSGFDELPITEQAEIIGSFQFVVRKTAHFMLYFILGMLSFLSVVTYTKISLIFRVGISALISLLYSISDEIHQLFVSGRSGEVRDVVIDFCGALLAIGLLWVIVKFNRKIGALCEKKESYKA